jgi:YVTN family beta-propeller protein
VANFGNAVSVIDGTTNTLIANVPVGFGPISVGVNPTNNRIYVANSNAVTVSVIDGATNTLITNVVVGSSPYSVGVNPVTNRAYVTIASFFGNKVSVIDGVTNTVLTSVPIGNQPGGIGVNPTTNRIYVADQIGDLVSVIEDGALSTLDARDDHFSTRKNRPLFLSASLVLGNDSNSSGKPFSIVSFTPPQHGRLFQTGTFKGWYLPDRGFIGTDTATYTIRDSSGATDTATITIDVHP